MLYYIEPLMALVCVTPVAFKYYSISNITWDKKIVDMKYITVDIAYYNFSLR